MHKLPVFAVDKHIHHATAAVVVACSGVPVHFHMVN